MLFSDLGFFVFFTVYFICHVLTPRRYRNLLIIFGSTIFYAYWNPYLLWVPYLLIGLSFGGAIVVDATSTVEVRKRRLLLTITLILLPLLTVKYTNFIWRSVLSLVSDVDSQLVDWPLPLGISFVTFTVIAYVVNVYKGQFPVERNLSRMAAYVLFFPHLIAGPILRPHELIPQLKSPRRAVGKRFTLGIAIFSVGLVKKLVFADQLAVFVDQVYLAGSNPSGLEYLIAIYGFSLQIYCDFSGYTDMAIGLAIVLGVRLPNNFHRPYGAVSLVDFWRRWHLTLSRWLRDYLYIPLGGNRFGFDRQIGAIILTMVIGGLWHGASWTFALWGLVHGIGIAMTHIVRRFRLFNWTNNIPTCVKIALTFNFVSFAWILFRAKDLETAQRIFAGPFIGGWHNIDELVAIFAFPLLLITSFYATHVIDGHARIRWFLHRVPSIVVWPVVVTFWVSAIAISAGSSAKFIYFDF